MAEILNQAFIQLINQNLGIAHKVCSIYFHEPDDREDAIQEMMYQLWRSYPNFDGRSKFSTWMYSVCLNTALTSLKNNIRERKDRLSLVHNQIPEQVSDDREEVIALLQEAIKGLSDVNKAIVLLYLENLGYDEIGSIMGLTRSNISVRIFRIKKELEVKLKSKI